MACRAARHPAISASPWMICGFILRRTQTNRNRQPLTRERRQGRNVPRVRGSQTRCQHAADKTQHAACTSQPTPLTGQHSSSNADRAPSHTVLRATHDPLLQLRICSGATLSSSQRSPAHGPRKHCEAEAMRTQDTPTSLCHLGPLRHERRMTHRPIFRTHRSHSHRHKRTNGKLMRGTVTTRTSSGRPAASPRQVR